MFAKHFACRARLVKILDIINECEANSVIYDLNDDYDRFKFILESEVDHTRIEYKMEKLRKTSADLLQNVINGNYKMSNGITL